MLKYFQNTLYFTFCTIISNYLNIGAMLETTALYVHSRHAAVTSRHGQSSIAFGDGLDLELW